MNKAQVPTRGDALKRNVQASKTNIFAMHGTDANFFKSRNTQGSLDLISRQSPDFREKANKTMGMGFNAYATASPELGPMSRLSKKSFASIESASEKVAFAHLGHEDWARQSTLQKTHSSKFASAKRFDYEGVDRKNAEQSHGPATGTQISSFQLPEIYRRKIPDPKSKVFAKTHRELSRMAAASADPDINYFENPPTEKQMK